MRPLPRGRAGGGVAMAVAARAGLEAAKQQGRGDLGGGKQRENMGKLEGTTWTNWGLESQKPKNNGKYLGKVGVQIQKTQLWDMTE